jgi:hypothetical protein
MTFVTVLRMRAILSIVASTCKAGMGPFQQPIPGVEKPTIPHSPPTSHAYLPLVARQKEAHSPGCEAH